MRNLKGRPPMSDVFGKGGRKWLAALELPRDERQTVDGCLRHIDFVNGEITMLWSVRSPSTRSARRRSGG